MKAAHLVNTEMNDCPQLRLPKSDKPLGPSDAVSSCGVPAAQRKEVAYPAARCIRQVVMAEEAEEVAAPQPSLRRTR